MVLGSPRQVSGGAGVLRPGRPCCTERVPRALQASARAAVPPHGPRPGVGMDRADRTRSAGSLGQLAALGRAAVAGRDRPPYLPRPRRTPWWCTWLIPIAPTRSTRVSRKRMWLVPATTTVETWISDSRGDPVMVVMAEPARTAGRRAVPAAGPAPGGPGTTGCWSASIEARWSPTCSGHAARRRVRLLTWRKGPLLTCPTRRSSRCRTPAVRARARLGRSRTVDVPLTDKTHLRDAPRSPGGDPQSTPPASCTF